MSELDHVEYADLAEQVRRVEKLINAGAAGDVDLLLKSFLNNARARMDEIRHEELRAVEEKKNQKSKEAASIVLLAEMEHNLSAEEKERYAGFLKLDYFTKANFGELEDFYATSWDKLSETGKAQMSARVWEGIKRKEYTFEELPQSVREKESERIYLQLTGKIEPSESLQRISPQVRDDFVREYEAGNEKAAHKILSGEDFSEYSPDTRVEVSLQDTSSSIKKESAEPKEKSSESPRELLLDTDISLEGVSAVTEVANAESISVHGTGSSLGKGRA